MANFSDFQPSDRRPIASRRLVWVRATASWLVRRGVSPNGISVSSAVFAIAGASAIVATPHFTGIEHRVLWFAAALCVQLRLLANLFDGMVAVESGKASPVGELFNEVPDRLADALLLIVLGFVQGSSVHLGYAAAILAVFVAYLRTMGGVIGAGQVFAGVMAKPQRMFLVTVLCLFHTFAPESWVGAFLPLDLGPPALVLSVICAGCVVTSFTRLSAIGQKLRIAA